MPNGRETGLETVMVAVEFKRSSYDKVLEAAGFLGLTPGQYAGIAAVLQARDDHDWMDRRRTTGKAMFGGRRRTDAPQHQPHEG